MPVLAEALEGRSFSLRREDFETARGAFEVGQDTAAGVRVTQDSGSRLSAAYSCIRFLAEVIGSLPWNVYRREDGVRLPAPRPRWMTQPNVDQERPEFIEQLVGSLNITGDAFALITNLDAEGRPLELVPLTPSEVDVDRERSGRMRYAVNGEVMPPHRVLHIPGFQPWPGMLRGLSPIEYCRQTFGLGQATEEYGAGFFARGANPSGVIQVDGDPGDEAIKAMALQWRKAHGGVRRSHLPGVLTHGAEWNPITIPNDHAQFLETRKFSRSEIAGIYRVPPHLIGDLERATFSNIEHQSIEVVVYTLAPWLERLEARFSRLVPRGQFVKFNVGGLLRGDHKTRFEAYALALINGWMNQDEVRALEDLPPIPDGNGQTYYRPLNLHPLGAPLPERPVARRELQDFARLVAGEAGIEEESA